jgi:ribulose-5-phosphate 4-epimerase/fuculose-1-phosphate aldolase
MYIQAPSADGNENRTRSRRYLRRPFCLAIVLAVAIPVLPSIGLAQSQQAPAARQALPAAPSSSNPAVRALIDDLVLANHILARQGVLDAYGHVSVRSPINPNHYFLARSVPAAVVTAEDIIEYDLDSKPVVDTKYTGFAERFIHGEIYKARSDVNAVIHGHAPEIVTLSVIPVPLRPMAHMAAFLGDATPVFEIRNATNTGVMLVGTSELGAALARTLGNNPAALMRGHGAVVVAESLHIVVGRAYYMNANARELETALMLSGGKVTYLNPEEEKQSAAQDGYERAWTLWKNDEPEPSKSSH